MSAFLTARQLVWSGWVVAALLMLGWLPPIAYGIAIPVSALMLALIPGTRPDIDHHVDGRDLAVIAAIYAVVVALYRLAFGYFTVDSVAGLRGASRRSEREAVAGASPGVSAWEACSTPPWPIG